MPEPTLLSTANIGTTEGLIPALGAGGKLASSLLPSIALTETLSVANAAARLALTTAQAQGKIVIEADSGKSYGLVTAGNPATSGDWLQLGDKDITAADITDSTAAGRTLLTAANAAAQIAALGAETPAGAAAKIAAATPGRGIPITSVAYTGDSITALAAVTDTFETTYPPHAIAVSERVIPNIPDPISGAYNFATSGIQSSAWLSTYIARVVALVSKPSHCVINIGTNDAQNFVAVANYMANIAAGVTSLRAAGIEPIIMAITPSPTATGSYWMSARYNRELAIYCAQNQIIFVDTRSDVASDTIEGLEVSGSLSDTGSTGGLHPKSALHYHFAQNLGRVFAEHVDPSIPTIWSEGSAINNFPNWSATTGSGQYPATNTTGPATLVARADGVTGNLLRLTIANNGTKSIGTGDAGIAFTAAAGVSQNDYDVFFRRDLNFSNGGSPFISVKTEKFTGRKIIMVWLETSSFVVSTQAGALITALNANPQVAAICTAASMGTPGSTVAVVGSTFDDQVFTTQTPASDEAGLTSGKQVRGVVEIWNPAGAQYFGIQLYNTVGTGSNALKAQVRTTSSGSFSSVPLPSGKMTYYTPWFTVTDHRRFYLRVNFGGANGRYDIGRTWVQMKNA